MSTQIVDNFKLNLAVPIDSRMVTTGKSSRNSIKYVYEGLRIYDITEKTPYVWIDGSWQKESSVVVSSGGGGGGSIPTGITNRIVKYTSSTTIGESSIVDKGTYTSPNVGIGIAPSTGIALDVKGMVKTNRFTGSISGSFLDTNSLDISKIKPHTVTTGEFSLKTIGGQVVWSSLTALNLDIVINNETSNTSTYFLLFANTSNSPNGTPIYANNNGSTRLIGVKPSTSQILASGDNITNNETYPSYSFSNTTNSGLYGNSNEVGLSFNGKALLKLNTLNLSIFDTSGNSVLRTETNKVIFTSGEFTGTLTVTGQTTLSGALQVNGSSTLATISTGTLNITGQTTLVNLTVTSTTSFSSLTLNNGLIVSGQTSVNNLDVSNLTGFSSLSLSTLIANDETTLNSLNVNGTARFNHTIPGVLTVTNLKLVISTANSSIKYPGTLYTGATSPTILINLDGASNFKNLNVYDTSGSSLWDIGIVQCTKLSIYRSSKQSMPFDYTKYMPENGTPYWDPNWYAPNSGESVYPPTTGGYEPGDIVFVSWTEPGKGLCGDFCFYRGRIGGWAYLGRSNTSNPFDATQVRKIEYPYSNLGAPAPPPSPAPPPGPAPGPYIPPDIWQGDVNTDPNIWILPPPYDPNRNTDTDSGNTPVEFF